MTKVGEEVESEAFCAWVAGLTTKEIEAIREFSQRRLDYLLGPTGFWALLDGGPRVPSPADILRPDTTYQDMVSDLAHRSRWQLHSR